MLYVAGLTLLSVVVAYLGWGAKISLSVGIGGAIGLANLLLWARVVAGLVAKTEGRAGASGGVLALQMFLKVALLIVLCVLVLRTSLPAIGVMIGFGSALAGFLVKNLCSPEA